MKSMSKISLIILLSCIITLNGEDKSLNETPLTKIVTHMTKIRNLEGDAGRDESGSSQESQSPPPDEIYGYDDPPDESPYESQSESSYKSQSQSSYESQSQSSHESQSQSSHESQSHSSYESQSLSSHESESQPFQESESQSSQGTNSPTIKNATETNTTNPPSIQLLAFSSFKQEPKKIKFIVSFCFNNKLSPKILKIPLTIFYESSLQEKQDDVTTECSIIGEPAITNGIVRYNCEVPKEEDDTIEQIVVNPDFKLENGDKMSKSEDISLSEEATVTSQNLQNQVQVINNMLKLENGELIVNSTNFIIKGDIDKYNGKVGDELSLIIFNNNTFPSIPQNVSCKTESIQGTKYEFKCTPAKDVKGSLHLSPMYIGDTSITLNMTAPNSDYYPPFIPTSNITPSIQILGFNSYRTPSPTKIAFNTYFSFINRLPPKIIRFTLTLLYGTNLQGKQVNETAECSIVGEPIMTNEVVQYYCEASKEDDGEIVQIVVNRDLKLENVNGTIEEISPNSGDINFSEEANTASQNLKNQTQLINKMLILENGELIVNSTYFIIKGDIEKYNGKEGDELRLVILNNNTIPATLQNVPCKTESIQGTKYEFKCTPAQDVKGSLNLSPMYIGDTSITLNMTAPNSDYYPPSIPISNITPSIQVLEFNSFSSSSPSKITFNTYFTFINRLPPKIIKFTLTILYGSSLKGKQKNETSVCSIVGEPIMTDEIVQYNCESPKEEAGEIEQVLVIKDAFELENANGTKEFISPNSGDINFSEKAAAASQNLQNQAKVTNKIFILENGELIVDSPYFIIKGDIDEYNGKEGDELRLVILNNNTDPATAHNVQCKTESIVGTKYEFKCAPEQDVEGSLYFATMTIGDISIALKMTAPNSDYYPPVIPTSTPPIQILEFNSFSISDPLRISFVTHLSFINRLPPSIITFTLTILYGSSLQAKKQNETAECSIIGEPIITNEIVQYNCEAPKEEGEIEQVVVNRDFKFEENANSTAISPNSGDINFSEKAIAGAENLQKQTQVINKILKLENGELIVDSTYFIIKGDINDYDGKEGQDFTLVIYDNTTEPATSHKVQCTTQSVEGSKFEFKCTPAQDVKGSLYLAPMYIGDTFITLNMTAPNSDYFSGYKDIPNSNSSLSSIIGSNPSSSFISTSSPSTLVSTSPLTSNLVSTQASTKLISTSILSDTNSNSSTPADTPISLPNTPVKTNNKGATILILGFNSYKSEYKRITFSTFFYFYQRLPPRIIRFSITILYSGRLRHLQGKEAIETSECLIDGDPTIITDENIKYNCEAPKEEGVEIAQITINPGLKLINADGTIEDIPTTSGDINFSEEASLGAGSLQNQNKQISKMLKLQNGELKTESNYFIIKGNIDKYNGKVGEDLTLIVYDNTTEQATPQNVSCITDSIQGTTYEFKCTPKQDVKGNIYLSPMYIGDTSIVLNMTEPNSYTIDFKINSTNDSGNDRDSNYRNNIIKRESSNGLSGGAIAGIIIVCAVALIAIAVATVITLRKNKTNNINDSKSNIPSIAANFNVSDSQNQN